MLILYNFRWTGTLEEFTEFMERLKGVCEEIEDIDFKGVFIPSSEWSYTLLIKTTSYAKAREAYSTYMQKYGPPQISLAAWTILHTFEELGVSSPL